MKLQFCVMSCKFNSLSCAILTAYAENMSIKERGSIERPKGTFYRGYLFLGAYQYFLF